MSKNAESSEPTFYSDAMTWLNGRLVSPLVVIHERQRHTIWTPKAGENGCTIENAIASFCEEKGIDMLKEVCGQAKSYEVELTAQAVMRTRINVRAGSKQEAIKKAREAQGDADWKYEGLMDGTENVEQVRELGEGAATT